MKLEHPDIAQIEKTGYPFEYRENTCSQCDTPCNDTLCFDCKRTAWDKFKYLMLNEFSDDERKYLDDTLDGYGLVNVENALPEYY